MYTSPFTEMRDRAEMEALVRRVGVATFVTVGTDGRPAATLLPVLWRDDRLIAHAATANPQFRGLSDDAQALAIVNGPDAYVSPMWYATRAKAGRAVPTWNYLSVHISGRVRLHRDPDWLRAAVTELSERHEQGRASAWAIDQAPRLYLEGLLLGIVGLEMLIERVEGKAKLSQNRVAADRVGIIAGLRAEPGPASWAVADEMDRREQRRRTGGSAANSGLADPDDPDDPAPGWGT
ncbi:MAG TPA: FMN-binding negative transcriptional regulator [Dermatophilaceae bacterium]|nr:FMN-binding negative transcriptional regulator [Dermatophilaceae bacterium]